MRTKTLLVTAALSVAAATSWAQVYSVNAVGYVNVTVPASPDASKGAIIANPLNGTNNNLNTVIPLPADGSFDNTIIYRWDAAAQTYRNAVTFISFLGGWLGTDEELTVNPGEGFWIFASSPSQTTMPITFVGEVPQGTLVNALPPANGYSIRSSIVPQAAPIGDEVTPNTLGFAAEDNDTIYVFDATAQTYKSAYTYIGFLGGWNSANPDDPGTQGPTIGVATGFFVQKGNGATKTTWTRTFSVN